MQNRPNPYITKAGFADFSDKIVTPSQLHTLEIELTERCNSNCIHCCINLAENDVDARNKELSTDKIKSIIDEAAALGCLTIKFTGGEPLLHQDFEDLYLHARRLGMCVVLFTNATLITDQICDLFNHIPPLEPIEITVYGMQESSYETVSRAPGSYLAAFRGIHLLAENQIPFVLKSALLPPNIGEIDAFEKWALKSPFMQTSSPAAMFFDLRHRHDSPRKNRRIKRLRLSPEKGLKFMTRNPDIYRKEMKRFSRLFMGPPGSRLFACGSGNGQACLDAYGNLQPCLLLRHPSTVYDMTKGSLKNAITSFFTELRKARSSNPEYLNRCARCFLKGLCEQCPGKSWIEHGILDQPVEYLCQIAHAQARYLGLLEKNEKAWQIDDWRERIEAHPETPLKSNLQPAPKSCRESLPPQGKGAI